MPPRTDRGGGVSNDLRSNALEFHEKASLLSDALAEAESFLQSLDGKIQAAVPTDEDGVELGFYKSRSGWFLYLSDQDEDGTHHNLVSTLNISRKTLAARFLADLYDAMNADIAERIKSIDAGLEGLRKLR